MPVIATHELTPGSLDALTNHQVYNGLDCLITSEVHEALSGLTNSEPLAYRFERALQAPVLEMILRGFKIDEYERQKGIVELRQTGEKLNTILQRYAWAVWGKGLNANSPKQLIDFFYSAMKLPEQWISQKGERKLSTNREALEKLEVYFHAMPIIAVILAIRDNTKRLSVLETEIDRDGRMRTSYNIAGTETGRFSSSASALGTGTNLQNITPSLRNIFIADRGKRLCGIDLEQAESREVGWKCGILFDDWAYLDACEAGDLHTSVSRLVWPGLPWTSDAKANRAIAEQPFYRHFSYRDMAKRGGHGTNYFGTAWTMARHLKVLVKLIEDFQAAYFAAFPGIPKWHRWVAQQIQTSFMLSNAFGRERHFFGRPNDDSTLREAIAFGPQSSTADRMNLGLWRLWQHFGSDIELLAQVHDAVYFQYDPRLEDEIVPKALELIQVWLNHGSRRFTIPGEAKVGWNWASESKTNPDGLRKYRGPGQDLRERHTGFRVIL